MDYFEKNPNKFTDGTPLTPGYLVEELDVIENAGLDRYTSDGVDLAYFLVQYSATNTVPAPMNTATGSASLFLDLIYITYSSTRTALREKVSSDAWSDDVNHNTKGAMWGYFSGILGMDTVKNLLHCPPEDPCLNGN